MSFDAPRAANIHSRLRESYETNLEGLKNGEMPRQGEFTVEVDDEPVPYEKAVLDGLDLFEAVTTDLGEQLKNEANMQPGELAAREEEMGLIANAVRTQYINKTGRIANVCVHMSMLDGALDEEGGTLETRINQAGVS